MNDIREIKSKEKIRKALLKILETKIPIDITIAEICSTADISRTTFYKYYRNTNDALDELLDVLVRETYMSGNEFYAFLMRKDYKQHKPFCELLRKDRRYAIIVRDQLLSMRFVEKITQSTDIRMLNEIIRNTGLSAEEIRDLFVFQLNGCITAVRRSMNRTDEEWEQERKRIDEFLKRGFCYDTFRQ